MGRKRRANKKSSAILTRSRKAKLDANSDASSSIASKKMESAAIVTESSTRQSGKAKVGSNVLSISDSNKAKTNTTSNDGGVSSSSTIANRRGKEIVKLSALAEGEKSKFKKPKTPTKKMSGDASSSMASKKKANRESATMVTTTQSSTRKRSNIAKVDSSSASNMAITNTSDGGGATSSSAMATRSSNRRHKETVKSPLAVAEKPNFKKPPKKRGNDESSFTLTSPVPKKVANVHIKEKLRKTLRIWHPKSKQPKLTISERADVQTSGVLTRRGKAKMDSELTPPADPVPPKSKKAKGTTSTTSSTRRGKAKMGSDPTRPADPQPPKSNKKAKGTTPKGNGSGSTRVTRRTKKTEGISS